MGKATYTIFRIGNKNANELNTSSITKDAEDKAEAVSWFNG